MGFNRLGDKVTVYERDDGKWAWRRTDKDGTDVLSTDGGQGYENQAFAHEMARSLNPGIMVVSEAEED